MYNEQIKKIMAESDILDIINSYNISTKSQGNVYIGKCPFCQKQNSDYSMIINPDEQSYRCFKCGAKGNVFIFVRDYEDISFIDAVKIVKSRKKDMSKKTRKI